MGVGPAARTRRGPAQFHARADQVIQDAGGDARPTWLCTSRSRAARRWTKVTDGVIKRILLPNQQFNANDWGADPMLTGLSTTNEKSPA